MIENVIYLMFLVYNYRGSLNCFICFRNNDLFFLVLVRIFREKVLVGGGLFV